MLAIVLTGALSIERDVDGRPMQIATLGVGEVIGEGILLEEGTHSSAGRAVEASEVLFFRKEPLMKLLKDQPALYAALLGRAAKIMSARIRNANETLLDTRTDWPSEQAVVGRWLDALADLAEVVGPGKAIQAAREANAAGKDFRSIAAPAPVR
jgi:CRP-like cAMP-binding protein